MQTLVQTLTPRYQLHETIGQGGMGSVYRGIDTLTQQAVAIKHLKPDLLNHDPSALDRFRQEGELLRQLNHPNIVHVKEMLEVEEQHYLVMDYVGGGSLKSYIEEHHPLPVERVLNIGLDLADALTRAHRLGVIHRDIKPANVLLTDDGSPRLVDFGFAHLDSNSNNFTATGVIVGTFAYLSPEACNGHPLDTRTDIWSFGVLLYELLAGVAPFDPRLPLVVLLHAILTQPHPPITNYRDDLPPSLVALVERMLVKDRDSRMGSVREVGTEIEAILRGKSTLKVIPPVTPKYGDSDSTQTISMITMRQNNLPPEGTPFVGRETELAEIETRLLKPDARLLSLVGGGGMGKTRLALHIGSKLQGEFRDGVYWTALAPLTSADNIAAAIAEAVGYTFFGNEPLIEQLIHYLRDKETLLILDNFEHLIGGADVVGELLGHTYHLKLLVTTRERLNLKEEHIYPIEGMPYPKGELSADTAWGDYCAIEFFVQSAQRTSPDFRLETNPLAVGRIAQLVDGSPLGLELAATWLRLMTVDEVLHEIEVSLDFLESNLRNIPDRHRSLRAVFDYSWQTLSAAEQSALACLAIFRGGFDRPAAATITQTPIRILMALGDKSLLKTTGNGRFEMHELIRQFAEEKLAADTALQARMAAQHSAYYVSILSQAKLVFTHGDKLDMFLQVLSQDLENIRLAWNWAIHHANAADLTDSIATKWWFYEFQGYFAEAEKVFKYAVDTLQDRDSAAYGWLLASLCWFYNRLNDYDRAITIGEQALQIARRHDDQPSLLVFALNNLGYVIYVRGEYDRAKTLLLEVLDLVPQRVEHLWSLGATLGTLGYSALLQGQFDEAHHYLEEALVVARRTKNPYGIGFGAMNLGDVKMRMGDYMAAKALMEDGLARFRQINYRVGIGYALTALGACARALGDLDEAERHFKRSLKVSQDQGYERGIGEAHNNLGSIAVLRGQHDDAILHLHEGLKRYRRMGYPTGIVYALTQMGKAYLGQGDTHHACESYQEALTIAQSSGLHKQLMEIMVGVAHLQNQQGNPSEAAALLTFVKQSTTAEQDTRQMAAQALDTLRATLDAATLGQADTLAAGWTAETAMGHVAGLLRG